MQFMEIIAFYSENHRKQMHYVGNMQRSLQLTLSVRTVTNIRQRVNIVT
jgi:siderophore synthetase component